MAGSQSLLLRCVQLTIDLICFGMAVVRRRLMRQLVQSAPGLRIIGAEYFALCVECLAEQSFGVGGTCFVGINITEAIHRRQSVRIIGAENLALGRYCA